jgi:hypothetical protein
MKFFTEKERENMVILAASRGVYEALTTNSHLGEAVQKYRYQARTFEGDAFETAFEWAREEKKRA